MFLGLWKDNAVFAVDLGGVADPTEGPLSGFGRFQDLRGAALRLSMAEAAILATAKGMFEWRRKHTFCSNCGQPSHPADGGWKRVCEACNTEHFPRTDPVVIMLPTFEGRCLLGRQAVWPKGMYSALAGFLEPGEAIEEACAREVKEEAGLTAVTVRYHSTQPWPYPSSLMIGLYAEVEHDNADTRRQTELDEVRWFTREEAGAILRGEFAGVSSPGGMAIAHQLIKAWAERDLAVAGAQRARLAVIPQSAPRDGPKRLVLRPGLQDLRVQLRAAKASLRFKQLNRILASVEGPIAPLGLEAPGGTWS